MPEKRTALETIDPKDLAAEKGESGLYYDYTEKEKKILRDRYTKFQYCDDQQNIPRRFFDELSYKDVINESVKRSISYLPPRVEGEWRTRVSMPETENKIQAYLAFAAQQRLRTEISARFKGKVMDKNLSIIIAHLNEYFLDEENFDEKFVDLFQELLVKPLAIMCEEYEYKTRWVKPLTEYNFETEEQEWEWDQVIDIDRPNARVVPCENFYFPDFYESNIQKQRYLFERNEIPYGTAEAKYGSYKKWKYVMGKSMFTEDQQEADMYFYQEWSTRISDDHVEELIYWDRENDVKNVILNGIPMIPLDSPMPFDHKDYPYSVAKAQKYDSKFLPGKPLPIKLLKLQDIADTLMNMFLDRTYFSVQPFFFTGFEDEIDISDISPGDRINVPDIEKLREANIQAVQQGDLSMHGTIMDAFNRSSMDPTQEGELANSQTATAIQMQREATIRMFGLTLNFMMWMTQKRERQRISNIIQFYPKHTAIKQATGNFKFNEKEVQREGALLSDGRIGVQVVRMVNPKTKKITQADVDREAEEYKEMSGGPVEVFYTTPTMMRNIEFKIRTIPNSSIAQTKSMEQAMFKENTDHVMERFGEQLGPGGVSVLYDETLDKLDLPKEKINAANKEIQEQQKAAAQDQQKAAMQQGGIPGGMSPGRPGGQISSQMTGNPAASLRQLEGMAPEGGEQPL